MAPKLQFGLHIGFLVDASLHERIVTAAQAQKLTMSDVIRAALERHLTAPDAVQASPERSRAEP